MIQLINADMLDAINDITAVDAIITDPPYNISKPNNFDTMGRSGIDFGEWDKGFDIVGWIPSAVSKLKKGGNIAIFNDWKNLGLIASKLEECDCSVKDCIRWIKTNPMPRNTNRRFVSDCEYVIWAVKNGDKWTFNKLSETYERPEIRGSLTPLDEKFHPTSKPVYVMDFLLKLLCCPGDIVLDPFMGAGTTGVSAIRNGCSFIGIEKDLSYFNIASDRIAELMVQQSITSTSTEQHRGPIA